MNSPSAVVQSLLDLFGTILFFFHGVPHVIVFPILFRKKSEHPTRHVLDITLFNEKVFEANALLSTGIKALTYGCIQYWVPKGFWSPKVLVLAGDGTHLALEGQKKLNKCICGSSRA